MPDAVSLAAPLEYPAPRPSMLPGEVRALVLEVAGKRIIDGVDLDIGAAGFTVIMGPNGAGKSVLIRLLHGLLQPSAGTIHWAGRALTRSGREHQAMVFQRPVLLRRSVRANLEFVLGLRRRDRSRADAWLRYVGLQAQAAQPARRLSGGEQQRLSLARALALDPQVLFLDEPTASLDPAATTAIENIILDAHRRGTKCVLVTHDLGQARRLADEVVFLNRGRVLEHTPAEAFFERARSPEARDFVAGRLVL